MQNPYQQYQQRSIETAGQDKLLLMLYEGAIRFLNRAREALLSKDIEQAHNNLIKAQNIIHELDASLNMEYEVAQSLRNLYTFMDRQLVKANINKDHEPVEQVTSMLRELYETWQEAAREVKQNNAAAALGERMG